MEIYNIFRSCFPFLHLTEDAFIRLSNFKKSEVILHEESGVVRGFAMICGEDLSLLCVCPEYRGRGIGSRLLCLAEEKICGSGGQQIHVGGRSSSLFLGAPVSAAPFFEKHGYRLGETCEEMTRTMQDFRVSDFSLPVPDGVTFDWYDGDENALLRAVGEVEEDWVAYFGGAKHVYCATLGGEIASFCLVDEESECLLSDGKNKVGVVGCVGTVPRFRRQGIGLGMVAHASEILRDLHCDLCFIHYTEVAHWYAKLGYKTFLKQVFAKKDLQ